MIATSRKIFLHLSPLAVVGGCEVNALRLIEGLGDADHHVLVFDEPGPMSARWTAAGARVEHLAAWRGGAGAFRAALAAWAQTQAVPAGIFYWSTSRLPVALAALRGWPVPWSVHLGNPLTGGLVRCVQRWLHAQREPIPSGVTLVACSNHVAASYRRAAYFRSFPIKVIYNPVSPDLDRVRAHRALPVGSAPRVGMVARLDVIKDHLTVIRALAALTPTRPDVVVEFAGDGELRTGLENAARRLGVADRVRFLGFVPVAPLLAEWDVCVHSTTPAEGMGTAVAEAMMAGLPCLVSELAVMREVCGEDGAAYARAGAPAAFADGLAKLFADQPRREALGRAAHERARRMFALAEVSEAYRRVVGGAPAEARG